MDDMAGRQQPPAVAVSSSGGCSIGTPLADYGESRTAECTVSIRIYVPELNIQKVLHFRQEELVWNVKQQCLATLPKELKESFNYGLFYPPSNGRAGKFLDDERPLSDYPFNGPLGYLELKYKRRVYKMLHLDEKQLRSLHTRVQLRRFLDYAAAGQAEKLTKTCAKGLDPNFHCQETGETPLTMAAVSTRPGPLLLALVGGGALLDYRTRCGSTALHRAAEKNNIEAVRTLLDLGASPGVRDGKGLTPLYNAILNKSSPMLCQALLHDYSTLGIQDAQGWHEVHQACRNGLVQHLENLLFYGADMNAKNASGNTPLHVCAVDNQEACARLLLFRGADRESLNFSNQTPYQVAVIAGNLDLASLIHSFKNDEVVPYKEAPSYNPRRRKSVLSMRHSISSNRLESSQSSHCLSTLSMSSGSSHSPSPSLIHPAVGGGVRVLPALPPPSPSPSDRWLELAPLSTSTASVRSDTGSSSSCTAESEDNASANGSSLTDKISVDQCDVVSDSSGVGTSNSGSGGSYDATPSEHSLVLPGMTVVCIEAYSSKEANHLQLQPGDIIEVTGSTDCGFLEGWLRGDSGYFPPSCVQEVRLRHPAAVAAARQHHSPLVKMPSSSPATTPTLKVPTSNSPSSLPPLGKLGESRIVGRRELSIQHYGTTPRMKSIYGEPRTVILHKGQRGFGFVLRGAKTTNSSNDWQPVQTRVPALQYLDSVEPDSVADRAGLRPGDFILAINGEDLAQASHETVVDSIRRSGNLVTITVCSAIKPGTMPSTNEYAVTGNNSNRQYSTLPRKLSGRPPQPPKRDPRTTLSVGRARARSMVAGLTEMESNRSSTGSGEEIYSNSTSRTASIRSRSGSGRVSSSDLERLSAPTAVAPPAPPSQQRTPRVYASVAEMKRMKKHKLVNELKLHKEFHSTPDLNWEQEAGEDIMVSSWTEGDTAVDVVATKEDWRKSQSQDDVYIFELQNQLNQRNSRHSWAFVAKNSGGQGAKVANGQDPRYHGSWQNIEQVYRTGLDRPQANEEEDPEDEETEEEVDQDDDGEDATTPIVDQVSLIGHGDYRAVKPCRPIYSSGSNTLPKQRASSPHVPPPDHPPPPPPPPSQVVRVDVSNPHSEYAIVTGTPESASASVMSSFRPSDSAKLYALPEDVESVGYSTLRPQSSTKNSQNSAAAAAAAAAAVAARSHSLPPRSVRPLISKTNGSLRNGKNVNSGSLDESRVTLTVNASPVIPEPDYDVDDVDNNQTTPKSVLKSNSRPSGRDLSTFSPSGHSWKNLDKSDDASDAEHHPSVRIEIKQSGFNMPKSQSFCADILKAKSLLKTSQSFPEDLSEVPTKTANGSSSTEGTYVTFLPVNSDQAADKMEASKERTNRNRNGNLTRHAVSLVQLPPPAENNEDPECSDVAERLLHESGEQDSVSTISTLSSLSTSSTSSDRDTTILESKPSPVNPPVKEAVNPSRKAREPSLSSDADRTIEESLQLIRMHVDALSDMKCLSPSKTANPPMVPPPPEFEIQRANEEFGGPFLPPPPPEFSDSDAAMMTSKMNRMIPKSPSAGHLRSQFNHFGEDHYSSLNSRLLHLDGGPHRRMMERRLSDDAMACSKPPTVRVVGAVPKKVSFSPDVIDNTETKEQAAAASIGKSFRSKVLQEWSVQDTADWLDSLFLSEYKQAFAKKNIDGIKLLHLNNDMLLSLGVKRVGHRLNMERSLKYYLHSSNAKPTAAPLWSE